MALIAARLVSGLKFARSGFNIILYGVGSKRKLLQEFSKVYCDGMVTTFSPLCVYPNHYYMRDKISSLLYGLLLLYSSSSHCLCIVNFYILHGYVDVVPLKVLLRRIADVLDDSKRISSSSDLLEFIAQTYQQWYGGSV